MAGMLAGVECARRRRFHHGGGSSDSAFPSVARGSRRSGFCLYTTNPEIHHTFLSSLGAIEPRPMIEHDHETLAAEARQAKQRLDERLSKRRQQLETIRLNSKEKLRYVNGRCALTRELHTEVFGAKKQGGSTRFSWARLRWKGSNHDVCTICLDRFRVGETLVHLPCAHRFHSRCLVPWLETNSHCPCCRMEIIP